MYKFVWELEEEEGLRFLWSRLKDSVEMCLEEKLFGYVFEVFLLFILLFVGLSVWFNWRFICIEYVDDFINLINGWFWNYIF